MMTTAPPGTTLTTEPRVEQISAEREPDLSTRTGQMRYLVAELGITRPQAADLLRAYVLDQRDRDARRFVREEFGSWLHRRGDIIVVRSKPHMPWRVASS